MATACPFSPHGETFAIRLSYSFTRIPQVFWVALAAITGGVFAAAHEEFDENKHVHLAIWNCTYDHDRLRKKLIAMVKEFIENEPPTGNALMSVKKWDGHEKYLIYMLKGDRHEVVWNQRMAPRIERIDDTLFPQLSSSYIEYLRKQWEEGNDQKRAYNEWKNSPHYPQPIIYTHEQHMAATTPLPTIPFDTIRQKALEFSLSRYGGFVNAKVRYEVKDLISNYCLFNGIKMCPIYI